ncbi:MAG TPA: MFS transporter, partial [Micromonosporaceae bacterium]|nr:MFS transporter [Micromonosporaceae bacterium]
MSRDRTALLIALGVDNFGSGLFLPLTLVYVTEVVGLPLGVAGAAVAIGTVAGLLVPPVAGRSVDRFGARQVVVIAQVVQALGAGTYLLADGPLAVVLAAVLLGAGQQLFYSSVFALIGDVAGDGPKDRAFAVVGMVRSAAFGLGGLAAAGVLAVAGSTAYRVAVAADALSFLGCAVVLLVLVDRRRVGSVPLRQAGSVLRDRAFLGLIGMTALLALSLDFFLAGLPVYLLDRLHTQPWLPGVLLAWHTAITSVSGTLALRVTRRMTRPAALAVAAGLVVVWCGACLAAAALPPAARPATMLAAGLLMAFSAV